LTHEPAVLLFFDKILVYAILDIKCALTYHCTCVETTCLTVLNHYCYYHYRSGFTLECPKVIGFCIIMLHDWLKKNSHHFFNPTRSKTKTRVTRSHRFPRTSRQLHVLSSNFDWFIGLSVSFVIGQSDYIGLGFTTLN